MLDQSKEFSLLVTIELMVETSLQSKAQIIDQKRMFDEMWQSKKVYYLHKLNHAHSGLYSE